MSSTSNHAFESQPDYWEPGADPAAALTRNLKGQQRREVIANLVSGPAELPRRAG